jgi:DNA primase
MHDPRSPMTKCAAILAEALHAPQASAVLDFLRQEKGLSDETIAKFGLGAYLSPQSAAAAFAAACLPAADIIRTGVLRRDAALSATIPWAFDNGQIGGVLYRRLTPLQVKLPKLLATVKYALSGDRDRLPWMGLAPACEAGQDHIVLVEGTFDYLYLAQAGQTNVVTGNSCSIRPNHLAAAKSAGIRKITIAFDPDEAGRRATLLLLQQCIALAIDCAVVPPFPDGVDPDAFVSKQGISAWLEHIAQAEDGLAFLARAITEYYGDANHGLEAAARIHSGRNPNEPSEDLANRYWPLIEHRLKIPRGVRNNAIARAYLARQIAPQQRPAFV